MARPDLSGQSGATGRRTKEAVSIRLKRLFDTIGAMADPPPQIDDAPRQAEQARDDGRVVAPHELTQAERHAEEISPSHAPPRSR